MNHPVIENDAQLAATLDYIAKWADTLEGMRRHEAEQNPAVFPTIAAGPLHEIRTNLEAARAFAQARSGSDAINPPENPAADNVITVAARTLAARV